VQVPSIASERLTRRSMKACARGNFIHIVHHHAYPAMKIPITGMAGDRSDECTLLDVALSISYSFSKP
jgi:hypothetical protein